MRKKIADIFNEYESAEITVDNYFCELREKDSEIVINRNKEIKGLHVRQNQENLNFWKNYQSIKDMIGKENTQSESMVKVVSVLKIIEIPLYHTS